MANIQQKHKYTKFCMVPECKNNSLSTPNKLFTYVPMKKELKKLWIEAVSQNSSWSLTTTRYCCEDHFNLQEDFIQSLYFKIIDNHKNICLKTKPGVIPHIFDCCKSKIIVGSGGRNNSVKLKSLSGRHKLDILTDAGCKQTKPNTTLKFIPLTTEENLSDYGMERTELQSVTPKLDNFINFEIDVDEIDEESNIVKQELDSDDDTFTEEITSIKDTETQMVQQEPIGIISDDENTNNKNSKRSEDVNGKFLYNKNLEECIVIDPSDDEEEQNEMSCEDFGSFATELSKMNEEFAVAKAQRIRGQEDKDSDDCIIISEDENSQEMEDMSRIDINNFDPILCFETYRKKNQDLFTRTDFNEEITEKDILKEVKIIDDEDDMCITSERLGGPQKFIIRRTDSVYSCPLDCTFLAGSRKLIIDHLITHRKKIRLQQRKGYGCPLCPYYNSYKEFFVNHIQNHKEPSFACRICKYVAPKPSCLKSHMHSKHGTILSCDNCRYTTSDIGKYFGHQMNCIMALGKGAGHELIECEDDFSCHFDPCPYTATSKEGLKTHEWIQHQVGSNNIKKFKCYIDYCNLETFREEVFQAHIDVHPGCQLRCKQCPYKTLDWQRFKDHVIEHVTGSS